MTDEIERPRDLRINASTGRSSPQEPLPMRTPWAQMENLAGRTQWLGAPDSPDEREWTHPDVGWGLVLPDNDNLPAPERAKGDDAPEAIGRLLQKHPKAPVLRWRKGLQQGFLRRYYADGKAQDLSAQAPNPGIGRDGIPRYLLIYASPVDIPWVQYALNMSTFVGRLDLIGPLMARAVAGKLWEKFENNADLSARRWLKDASATREGLAAALAELSPALVVTTSHGMTGQRQQRPKIPARGTSRCAVCRAWHAASRRLATLRCYLVLACLLLCGIGCRVALQGPAARRRSDRFAAQPDCRCCRRNCCTARAFSTRRAKTTARLHRAVEPTFDWTLRDPANKQVLTHALCGALYDKLYKRYERNPIGWALQKVYQEAGAFYGSWQDAIKDIDKNVPGMRGFALYRQLVAMDRQTMVILGDPTVTLPPMH